MTDESPKRPLWVTLLLVSIPVWLLLSGAVGIWLHFRNDAKQALVEQERFAQSVSESQIEDSLKKLVTFIGERNPSSDDAAKNLKRAAAMIEGQLGPSNTGYTVHRTPGPATWPLIHVTLSGSQPDLPSVWVLASYDSKSGSPGAEANATGLTATLAAAQALANDKPARTVHFAFIPHANDPESPVIDTAAKFRELTEKSGAPHSVLYIEAMGAGESLWLSSRDTNASPLNLIQNLGSIHGAEDVCLADDTDFTSILFEMGLSSVRVATRPVVTADETDQQIPPASTVAASTGRLVELIRRCATAH
jgi:hypothetical protein